MNDLSFEQCCISARNIVCLQQVLHIFALHFVESQRRKNNIKNQGKFINIEICREIVILNQK